MVSRDLAQTAEKRLTPAQAALRLGVTPAMIRHWADRGRLTCERTPLGRLVDADSVERLRAERAASTDDRLTAAGSPAMREPV
jgi:DNA-binding transcriptional MerR regulator